MPCSSAVLFSAERNVRVVIDSNKALHSAIGKDIILLTYNYCTYYKILYVYEQQRTI
jgi:hypothetical protein